MLKLALCVIFLTYTLADVEKANVVLKGDGIEGTITFTQVGNTVTVEGNITGVPEGKHGFHVHDKGDLSNGCVSAAGHFNPLKKNHGAPTDTDRHVGDLGNIVADTTKVATVKITDSLISLNGANSIIGRAVVLHADADDLGQGGFADSKTTGHAGARLACGVIGIANEAAGKNTGSHATSITQNPIILLATLILSLKVIF